MNYHGDQRRSVAPGDRLGPDAHGSIHEVTTVTYDAATDRTRVHTRILETEGRRTRFAGGAQ